MTIVKQVSITSPAHLSNLGKYLNDERALARDSQHLINEDYWDREMNATREAYGHNSPARAGAANTYMYHQVISFNPDECDCNGGKMNPDRCMAFAKEWVEKRYPNQEVIWVLHKEHCAKDGTDRYAVHVGINRTNLETGKRLDEGRSKYAKIERANAMRDMDKKWQLSQVRANERNSRVHARQPTRAEQEMKSRGIVSEKERIRQAVKHHVSSIAREAPQANRMRELAHRLKSDNIHMTMNKSSAQIQFRSGNYCVNGNKLGRGFSVAGITKGLGMSTAHSMMQAVEQDMER